MNALAAPPTRHAPRLLSIVTPAHDEAANLPELYRRLEAALTSLGGAWEWIVVDDASTDGTSAVLRALASTHPAVRPLRQPRRAGSHAAILAGCRAACGDAAVVLVADLQDPPEMIPSLLAEWRRGADVVWAARAPGERQTNGRSPFGSAYYWLMRYVAGLRDLPPYGADLVAIDGSVLEMLRQRAYPPTSVLALIAAVGRTQTSIPSRRAPRVRGRSGWTTAARVRLALASLGEFTAMRARRAWRSG